MTLTLVIGNKNYSSWSLRPWLAMKQAGLNFGEICITLDTPTTTTEIRRYSPTGKVPVLLDGEIKVWESLAICEYIAESYCPQLWPKDRHAKSVARAISAEMHSSFMALRKNLPMDCRAHYPDWIISPEARADINRILEIWRDCREHFGTRGKFLFGDFSIADCMYAPVVSRFFTYGIQLEGMVGNYAEALREIGPMQEWFKAARYE